jgi:hypothetical protein
LSQVPSVCSCLVGVFGRRFLIEWCIRPHGSSKSHFAVLLRCYRQTIGNRESLEYPKSHTKCFLDGRICLFSGPLWHSMSRCFSGPRACARITRGAKVPIPRSRVKELRKWRHDKV